MAFDSNLNIDSIFFANQKITKRGNSLRYSSVLDDCRQRFVDYCRFMSYRCLSVRVCNEVVIMSGLSWRHKTNHVLDFEERVKMKQISISSWFTKTKHQLRA